MLSANTAPRRVFDVARLRDSGGRVNIYVVVVTRNILKISFVSYLGGYFRDREIENLDLFEGAMG